MKKISIVSPTYNEEFNINELYRRVKNQLDINSNYSYEIIFIDNASTDNTVKNIKTLISLDDRVKLIVNTRNFGHIRSPYWGILQSSGDATIYLASDLQDPPEKISTFISEWEKGWKVVLGIKPESHANPLMHKFRQAYYSFLDAITDIKIIKHSTGFGLYDSIVLNELRKINDPYPFLRGLISELGYPVKLVNFTQPIRKHGKTKNNLFTLYDIAMLGIVNHSLFPIRIAAFIGISLGLLSMVFALIAVILKFLYWDNFPLGSIPLIIGVLLMLGVNLIFIGILGEYVANILAHVRGRPIVVESERVNF
jgi:glycosyltransferase involved in cell wall biosynthesis